MAHTTYMKVMELRRFLATGIEEKGLITVEQKDWNHGPTECANAECKKDLRAVNPIYAIRGKEIGFCSQACRATLTGEQVKTAPAMPDAGAVDTPAPAPKGKGKAIPPAAPAPKGKAGKTAPQADAPKRTRTVVSATATLHITRTDHKFHGSREVAWGMVKEGMLLQAFYDQCDKAGINGKAVLSKIMGAGKCVEIRG
jgi:hypothetical protein